MNIFFETAEHISAKASINDILAEVRNSITAIIKSSAVKISMFATGIALAGVMNTVEVNAQPAVEKKDWWHFILFGQNDPVDVVNGNFALRFGKGSPIAGQNFGLWSIGVEDNGFNIGRVYNAPGPGTAGQRSLFINAHGAVAIGHWAPATTNNIRLDVNGNIRAWNLNVSSDSRYKRDIKPIGSLDNLFKINSVQYKSSGGALREQLELFKQKNKDLDEERFNSAVSDFERQIVERNADQRTHFGFIAQELREVYPDLVYEDEQGFLSIDYIGMIPMLLEAIKELRAEIKGKDFEKTGATVMNNAKLYQNNPNPFSENTEIQYYVPADASSAMICIYDLTGSQIIRFDLRDRGVISSLTVRGNQLKAGMYIYSLIVDGREIDTKRMILTDK